MKASTIAGVVALAASSASAQYLNESAPFQLVILSDNSTINGSTLNPCHEGAAIEGLCLGAQLSSTATGPYNFNSSTYPATANTTIGVPGYLTYVLEGGNFNVSEPLSLSYNPTSNVAVPLFSPESYGTLVAFDDSNKLNIQGYLDDRTYPATVGGTNGAYYRWYVCITNAGYTYTTLAWAMGEYAPENPTCQKVDVQRVFV